MMKDMKQTGIQWIGEIPKSWEIIRTKHFSYMKGRIGWQGLTSDEFIESGPYLVTGTDFDNGRICWERSYHISSKRYEEAPDIQLQVGDLLVTKDGTIGKLAYIDSLPGQASLNSHLLVIRPLQGKYINRYLFWVLSSTVFIEYYSLVSDGSTMDSLSQEKMGNFSFPVPSIDEQEAIADFLDKRCGELDSIIADLEQQIELLKAYKKSLITETVTKGLDKSVPMKDCEIEWIGDMPEHWETNRILYLLEQPITDGPHTTPEMQDDGIPFISAEAVSNGNGRIDFDHIWGYISEDFYKECCKKYVPKRDDIYMIKSGATTGRVAIVDTDEKFTIWSPLAVFRCR